MSFARSIRLLLAFASMLIVAWSFIHVGARVFKSRPRDKVELTILHWGDPDETAIIRTLVDDFQKSHPNIAVKPINGGSDYSAKLKTMFAAGTPPDLFYLGSESVSELGGLKLLKPIDNYIARETSTEAGKQWLADFFPVLLDAYRYDGTQIGRGPLYGLPKDFTTCIMYVNLDLFEKAGLKAPYDGWTFDEFEDAMKRITALSDQPEFRNAGRQIYGGVFDIWPASLLNIVWNFGGDYFDGADFRHPKLTDPNTQRALEFVRRLRLVDRTIYNPTGIAKAGGQEFFTGNIGAYGMIGRWKTPQFRGITTFRWDCVPMPHAAGVKPASQIFTTAWTMAASTKHPDESFELMKYLTGAKGQRIASKLGLAIPSLRSEAKSDAFLDPATLPEHDDVFLKAGEVARLQQHPTDTAEFSRIVQEETDKAIQTGRITCMEAGQNVNRRWLELQASPLKSRTFAPMNWRIIGWLTLAGLAVAAAAIWLRARREKIGPLDRATERAGWLFIAPWLIGFFLLTLGPMVASALLSITRWTAMTPLSQAQFVGDANYRQLLAADPTFVQSLKVTAKYALLAVPVGQIAALAVALLMNARLRGISIFRTVYFVPSVIGPAAMSLLWLVIFNNDYGLINPNLNALLAKLHLPLHAPNWFGVDTTVDPPVNDAARWAIPAFVLMSLWGVGSGMIIYLAGLKGIPTSYYEAATIDGASPARKLWNVTLPMLSPLIFFNFVMAIIGSFQVFTQAYMMTREGPENATLFYVLNLYMHAFQFHNMGYASAMAWILFVIVLLLTAIVFRGARNVVYYEGLKA